MKSFASLPKVELHVHLDCSLSMSFVQSHLPHVSPSDFLNDYALTAKVGSLAEFLKRIPRSLALLQARNQLTGSVLDLANQLRQDNVIYAEIRLAPLLHTHVLTQEEVADTVCQAVQQASKTHGIPLSLIFCTLRHFNHKQSMETAELACQFNSHGVLGFDLAADEAGHPLDAHVAAFKKVQRHGIPCTAHAGEALGSDSVRETLHRLKPLRIGHGVRSVEDPTLLDDLVAAEVHLEICPTSNVLTGVFPTINHHSIDSLRQSGVSLSINTDGRTVPLTTLEAEYDKVARTFGWREADFRHANMQALKHSFASTDIKEMLLGQLQSAGQ
ncbi:MAG: adenosine deaminase [Acidobacteria bacterium]|nr:adenosine deaminase [Acidobacteriota bacterium]